MSNTKQIYQSMWEKKCVDLRHKILDLYHELNQRKNIESIIKYGEIKNEIKMFNKEVESIAPKYELNVKEYAIFNDVWEEKWSQIKIQIQNMSVSSDKPTTARVANSPKIKFDINKIQLIEQFDGNMMNFPLFWAEFVRMVDQTDLSDEEKFAALKSKLDDNTKRRIIGLGGKSYKVAKKILVDYLLNPNIVKKYYLQNFQKEKKVENSKNIQAFRNLITEATITYANLKLAKVDNTSIEIFGLMLIERMPDSILTRCRIQDDTKKNVETIIDQMRQELLQVEEIEGNSLFWNNNNSITDASSNQEGHSGHCQNNIVATKGIVFILFIIWKIIILCSF